MKKYYLIGQNIDNSLSPAIHNWIYSKYNIDALYSCKSIDSIEFETEIGNIRNNIEHDNISGINITSPYKLLSSYRIFSPSLLISKESIHINAINCIYKIKNKIMANNTDWYGFIKSLELNTINTSDYNIVIIGAGGASRAVIYGLQILGVTNIKIYNRTKGTIEINNMEYNVLDIEDFTRIKDSRLLIINCLPNGIFENNFILSDKMISQIEIFYDLNYIKSDIHDIMKIKDIKVIDGLEMLIYQAIKSIELWSNQKIIDRIDINDIKQYLLELK